MHSTAAPGLSQLGDEGGGSCPSADGGTCQRISSAGLLSLRSPSAAHDARVARCGWLPAVAKKKDLPATRPLRSPRNRKPGMALSMALRWPSQVEQILGPARPSPSSNNPNRVWSRPRERHEPPAPWVDTLPITVTNLSPPALCFVFYRSLTDDTYERLRTSNKCAGRHWQVPDSRLPAWFPRIIYLSIHHRPASGVYYFVPA